MKIEDLKEAPYNPRTIDDGALHGLGYSMEEFGDLSGITWNKRTGHLVCGHQRVRALKEMGASLEARGNIHGDPPDYYFQAGRSRFDIREVDWPVEKEKAANVAANNYMIAGRFDGSLIHVLDEVKIEFGEEAYDALRLMIS